jgi:hypothetical protein
MSSSFFNSNLVKTDNLILTNNSNFKTTVTASSNMSSNLQIVLPPNAGSANNFLRNDGTGTMSWANLNSQTGPTGSTGPTGLGITGTTGPTGILGGDPVKNFYLYAASILTINSVPVNGLLTLVQVAPVGTGITWITNTATVTQAGTYKIIYFGFPTTSTTIGISINGAAPQASHKMGFVGETDHHANCFIVRLNANDTVSIMNIGSTATFYSYNNGLAVSAYLTMYRIEF